MLPYFVKILNDVLHYGLWKPPCYSTTRALRALTGVGLSLDPEGKEKSSWSYSSADLVFTARNAVAL